MNSQQKGFTLIELLVVIAIIGILSSVVLASLNSARLKARDADRLSSVKQIQNALELYQDSNAGYPSDLSILVSATYIATVPGDPLTGVTPFYAALEAGCTGYHLGVTLEDTLHGAFDSDADASGGTSGTGCPDGNDSATDFDGSVAGVYDVIFR